MKCVLNLEIVEIINVGGHKRNYVHQILRLEDGDKSVRTWATEALGNLGNASEVVISALLVRLEDGDYSVRRSALEALGKLGLKSSDVLPAVVQWIDRPQDTAYVGSGIDVLWNLVASEGN